MTIAPATRPALIFAAVGAIVFLIPLAVNGANQALYDAHYLGVFKKALESILLLAMITSPLVGLAAAGSSIAALIFAIRRRSAMAAIPLTRWWAGT